MGNNMNCESCSANTRNMTHQRDMMHQREMMYQRDMRMPRRRCDVPEPCENQRIMPQCEESCERNRMSNLNVTEADSVIGISASGNARFTCGALQEACSEKELLNLRHIFYRNL